MAKDKQTTEQATAQSSPEAGSQPAAVVQTAPPATVPAIVEAIKEFGPSFTMAQRQEIIRTVATLPPHGAPAALAPYDGVKMFAFRLTHGDISAELSAHDDLDARRMFNESVLRATPSPRAVKVECLGEVKAEAAAAAAA